MPISKLQDKQKTRVPKVPEGISAFGGRSKETESSVHGRTKHVIGVSLADSLCDGQSRREKLPHIACNMGDRKGVIPMFVPVVSTTGTPLMPTHHARARQLLREGKAKKWKTE